MLSHSIVKWDVVILAPSSERVKEEDWVLETLLEELLSGVLEEENVTVVEWVSNLESVHGIGLLLLDLFANLGWGQSILVHAIVELDVLQKSHAFT